MMMKKTILFNYRFSEYNLSQIFSRRLILNGLLIFVLTLAVSYVDFSLPHWSLMEIALHQFSLKLPSQLYVLNLLKSVIIALFGLFFWWLTAFLVSKLTSLKRREVLRKDAVSFIVFTLPLLAGHRVLGGSSLFNIFLVIAFLLFIVWKISILKIVFMQVKSIELKFAAKFCNRIRNFATLQTFILITVGIIMLVAVSEIIQPLPQPTGDEPNYLIIAHSLVVDRDLNLKNNYQNEDYRLFYHDHLYHRVSAIKSGLWLPSQGIGLPILLMPAYWIGLQIGNVVKSCRIFMVLLALLTIYNIFGLLFKDLKMEQNSLWGIVGVAASSPFLIYSTQIYPEIPGALLLTLSVRFLVTEKKLNIVISSFAAGLLPWLGIKFMIPLGAMFGLWICFLIISYFSVRARNWLPSRIELIFRSIIIIFFSTIFFGIFYKIYGTFDFVSTHGIRGTSSKNFGSALFWALSYGIEHASQTLRIAFGYFIDQRVGILIYAPIYIFALAGIIIAIKKRSLFGIVALTITLSHWALFAWTGQWEGYCPPTRYLVPLAPFFAYWLGLGITNNLKSKNRRIVWLFLGLSSIIGFHILFHLHRFYHYVLWRNPDEKNHLLSMISNSKINWTSFFPSFTVNSLKWSIIIPISILIIILIVLFSKKNYHSKKASLEFLLSPVLWFSFLIFFTLIAFIIQSFLEKSPNPEFAFSSTIIGKTKFYLMTNDVYKPEKTGFWLRGRGQTRVIWKSTGQRYKIHIHSLTDSAISIFYQNRSAEISLLKGQPIDLILPNQKVEKISSILSPTKNKYSDIFISCSNGYIPAKHSSNSQDFRFLGCFINITSL